MKFPIALQQAVENVNDLLPELIEACNTVSDLFYRVVNEATWKIFTPFFRGIDSLYRVLKDMQKSLIEMNIYPFFAYMISENLDKVAANIEVLNRHIDDDDNVMVGDIIRYELKALLQDVFQLVSWRNKSSDKQLRSNMAVLKRKFPHVYDCMAKLVLDESKVEVIQSKNGSPNLCRLNNADRAIVLHSLYSPEIEANLWAESISEEIAAKQNVLIYGFGCGYHLEALIRKFPDRKFHVYEPEEQLLAAALRVVDLESLVAVGQIDQLVIGQKRKTGTI
ncbi:hypothetical protein [Paenibacillus albus]|uniref:Glycosyltransferase Maf N-terminal domain-containing protein n=1 Tax=Paenibacillus albus TaxID=2495582 RepID=A0A3Q8X1U9_9BACL|nr:hypothetical protein [Paenibacillus albus]AZN38510.1 hypothetical protein EJC50_01615 [Paenibacillus albus]